MEKNTTDQNLAKELSKSISDSISTDISFLLLEEDEKNYLKSKNLKGKFLLKYAYITGEGTLCLDGETQIDITRFLDIGAAIVILKLYSDVLLDWDEDALSVFTKLEKLQMETTFFDKAGEKTDEIKNVMPLAAYLYDPDGIIYQCDLIEVPDDYIDILSDNVPPSSYEEQNMFIEDAESEYANLNEYEQFYR